MICVNVNNAVQEKASNGVLRDVCHAKVSRTDHGWQLEMSIEQKGTRLNKPRGLKSAAPVWLSISRYYRIEGKEGKIWTECSTITPIARTRYNWVRWYYIIWGPQVVWLDK